jgi:predicted nuclease of predicted toxin-antitoxin system
VPSAVGSCLRGRNHEVLTAHQAHLEDASDEHLIAYAQDRHAILVTTNRDCAAIALRMRSARVVWLQVREVDAQAAMERAADWLEVNPFPPGRVLRVRKRAAPALLSPPRWERGQLFRPR